MVSEQVLPSSSTSGNSYRVCTQNTILFMPMSTLWTGKLRLPG